MAENVMFSFYEPDDYISGVSFREWIIRYFKWVWEKPMDDTNPVFATIIDADMQPYDKSHDVWLLPGGYERIEALPDGRKFTKVSRRVVGLPANKSVLTPVLCFCLADRKHKTDRGRQQSLVDLKEIGDQHTDNLLNAGKLLMEINGHPIPVNEIMKYRLNTNGLFDLRIPGRNNMTRMRHVLGRPIDCLAKGDGYWLFFKPGSFKPEKTYNMHAFTTCAAGVVNIDKTNQIEVM